MRLLHWYLIAYFLLLAGAGLSLWQAGVLSRLDSMWVTLGAILAVGLGLLLVVTSAKPRITSE